MGTRALTRVEHDGQQIISLYRQFDGYPSCHGQELFNFLDGMKIVNGFNGSEGPKAANGAGCLSAQIVSHFKKGIGGFYLNPVTETDCWQDYEYIVTVHGPQEPLHITCISHDETLFKGTVEDFGAFCTKDEE